MTRLIEHNTSSQTLTNWMRYCGECNVYLGPFISQEMADASETVHLNLHEREWWADATLGAFDAWEADLRRRGLLRDAQTGDEQ